MIRFQKVRFKNFGSFGNTFTELVLDKNNTTLICGSNGSGKSFAFLDSITFALFGKPFRKINIPQLANSINSKNCLVEIEFTKGNESYIVRRGLNPKIFEIHRNGELLNQDAKSVDYQTVLEEQIIKMNYKTFTQVVILGSSSFVPFMQLNAADRRAVIENILDINVFSSMNMVLKGKMSALKESLKEVSTSIEIQKEKIQSRKDLISNLESKSNKDIENTNQKIQTIESEISELLKEITELEVYMNEITSSISDKDKVSKKQSEVKTLKTKIGVNLSTLIKDIAFFTDNETCPSCCQSITNDVKEKELQKRNKKKNEYEKAISDLEYSIQECDSRIKEINDIAALVQDKNLQILQKKTSIDNGKKFLKSLVEDLKKASNSYDQINSEKGKLQEMETVLGELESKKIEMKSEEHYYQYASDLLKDTGVKAKIIKYYLPFMNKYINKFLTSMDFFVQFILDEDFNETIKSRHRDEMSYMNFSEGEKMRIDLALLLAWREIARAKNSVNCNLLILDEVFDSSLDSLGMEELMKLLNAVSDKSNIYVISHKSDQLVDKFQTTISFEKKNNFSRML
jgi:DNA repair exonuclease SbcCD ATPase subunit